MECALAQYREDYEHKAHAWDNFACKYNIVIGINNILGR